MLIRTLIFFILLIAAAIGVDKLAKEPGALMLNWHGWYIETTAAFFVVCLGFLLLLVFLATKAYIWLDLLPKRLAYHLKAQRQEKGLTALSDSMASLAVGDYSKAVKEAKSAKKSLPHLPLADAVLAQASASTVQNGSQNEKEAIAHYNKLLDNSHTELSGLKGLLQTSLNNNDSERALTYAEAVYQKTPKNPWIIQVLIDLYARHSRYEDAGKMAAQWQKMLPRNSPHKQRADFLMACNTLEGIKEDVRLADASVKESVRKKAEQKAEALFKKHPEFAPAALFLADLKEQNGHPKDARKVLRQAYHKAPSHKLADAWLRLMKNEKDDTLAKRVNKFIGPWDDHVLGLTVKGKALIKARQWTEAHKTLSRALLKGEDRTLFETLAKLEQAQHPNGGGATRWLERALNASDRQRGSDGYISAYQNWRQSLVRSMASGNLPHIEPTPFVYAADSTNASAVLPGQLEDKTERHKD